MLAPRRDQRLLLGGGDFIGGTARCRKLSSHLVAPTSIDQAVVRVAFVILTSARAHLVCTQAANRKRSPSGDLGRRRSEVCSFCESYRTISHTVNSVDVYLPIIRITLSFRPARLLFPVYFFLFFLIPTRTFLGSPASPFDRCGPPKLEKAPPCWFNLDTGFGPYVAI